MLHETELLHETKLLHETESHWADIAGWTSNKEIGSKAESKLRARVVPGVYKKQKFAKGHYVLLERASTNRNRVWVFCT